MTAHYAALVGLAAALVAVVSILALITRSLWAEPDQPRPHDRGLKIALTWTRRNK